MPEVKFCDRNLFEEVKREIPFQAPDYTGCYILFIGVVKNPGEERRVRWLEVNLDEELKRNLEEIVKEAVKKFSIIEAKILKKGGKIRVGEALTAVIVASRGRREGFEAASWIIDRIKECEKGKVVEVFENGATGGI